MTFSYIECKEIKVVKWTNSFISDFQISKKVKIVLINHFQQAQSLEQRFLKEFQWEHLNKKKDVMKIHANEFIIFKQHGL